jgi:alpha-glucoside transport system substrate-binding protein
VIPEKNLKFFETPGFANTFRNAEIFQSTAAAAMRSTPQTRAFMKFIESTPAQALLASANHWNVADRQVPVNTYSSALLRDAAKVYFGPNVQLATGPNSLANAAVAAAFYKGVMQYLQNPATLNADLQSIELAQKQS